MGTAAIRTTCPYCGVGCGVLASMRDDGGFNIKGDPEHPANFGRLCSKGSALAETLSLEDRLLTPLIDGKRADWDDALDLIVKRFKVAIAEHGRDSVALYVSGQILTEDYYVANKLMKGFIGTANIDTNSRLCMASSVAGHKRAFGSDTVPGVYEDLELADLVVLVGSNLAWCHPVLYQRLAAARERRGTKVVVVDPRRTATCEIADLHLAIAPGADVALFNGLLAHLLASERVDHAYVARHTTGFDYAIAAATSTPLGEILRTAGLSLPQITDFYELFAANERTVTVYSQGVNQSSSGTDKVNAIINCHLATGRIGRPGMGPFSVTGQPNAMGGREVGGLANMLAAHMELTDPSHRHIVQSFWRSPTIADRPGLKAVDLFRAVGEGRIKALWIMGTNPVDSMPEADSVRKALAACPFVVVSDVTRHTDSTALAHVLLPSAAWGEKDGTVTNSERRISRQRSFLALPGEARPDWWQLAEVGKRLGFPESFSYTGPHDIFTEYAALTAQENSGSRDLDIGAYTSIRTAAYDALAPFQWPAPAVTSRASEMTATRLFSDGRFFTSDRRARFAATPYCPPANVLSGQFPFVLNTGRIRDQWHTMTRTAKSHRLMAHAPEPVVEIHPADAHDHSVRDGEVAELTTAHGRALLRVAITDAQRPGSLFVPMHWTEQHASAARVDALVGASTDPISGQPELKYTPASIRRYCAAWHGFALSISRPDLALAEYAARATIRGGHRIDLADAIVPADWEAYARRITGTGPDVALLAYHDPAAGQHRFAMFDDDRLVGALFVNREPSSVARTWAADQIGKTLTPPDRLRLLAGRPCADVKDRGPVVCACFEVGRNEIAEAVTTHGCLSVAAVGERLKAGTNCGSCRAEIGRIVASRMVDQSREHVSAAE